MNRKTMLFTQVPYSQQRLVTELRTKIRTIATSDNLCHSYPLFHKTVRTERLDSHT